MEQLVFDALEGFDADAFAMALGLVRGGGLFLLLTPPLEEWPTLPDREMTRLAVAGQETPGTSHFLQRLARMLKEAPPGATPVAVEEASPGTLTRDQARALEQLQHLATGHPRRPLVITADRGRGKSALLGIFAARRLQANPGRILVTAPRQGATGILFRHALEQLPGSIRHGHRLEYRGGSLEFLAPDALIARRPRADLLLVDEAAGIPLHLLEQLVLGWSRVALATTVHGYEGSGRGFLTRFRQRLDEIRPRWRHLHLQEPVRWASGDPLERFGYRALLLDAEPADVNSADITPETSIIRPVDPRELIDDEQLLEQLFGLLVSAHYRTTPQDLRYLLDAPSLSVQVMTGSGRVLAAALVAREGRLPEPLRPDILSGKRRPRGHLLPQLLATRCGLPEALELACERVVRIAVHPRLQGRGLGSRLLAHLVDSAAERKLDILGTSFGAMVPLARFWKRAGFLPLRLGHRREASSGAHALVMGIGLNHHGRSLLAQAAGRFQEGFPFQLGEQFRELSPELALALREPHPAPLIDEQRRRLRAYSRGRLPYLDALPDLHALARRLCDPADPGQQLVVAKVLQRRQWKALADQLGLPGSRALEKRLRDAVFDLAQCREESG